MKVTRNLVPTGDASGDPALARELVRLRGRLTPRVAAAVVELDPQPLTRIALVSTARRGSRVTPADAVDEHPRFELGSITKGLTGMLLADAIARGELTLDTTAGEILDARSPLAAGDELRSVTLRELCTHASGLPRLPLTPGTVGRLARLILFGLDPYRGQSPQRVLALAGRQRLRGRGSYRYSNLGGALAGQLLGIAAGGEYQALLRERVLAPLRMTSSAIAVRGATAGWGRSVSGRRRQPWVFDGYAPAGGAIATIEDVARLMQALLDGSAPGVQSLQPLADAVPSATGREAGIFWIVEPGSDERPTLTWHNGATGGYSAFLGLQREQRRGVAVLADLARPAEPRRIAEALLGLRSRAAPRAA